MAETILSGIAAYIGTNLDDLLIGMMLFVSADTAADVRGIWLGKYCGIGALTALSLLGALGCSFLPAQVLGLLGIVPILLGAKEFLSGLHPDAAAGTGAPLQISPSRLPLTVTAVTIANGADNLGVYIPLFTDFGTAERLLVCGIFAGMTAIWCVLSQRLSALPVWKTVLVRYKPILVPVIYCALGVYVLLSKC